MVDNNEDKKITSRKSNYSKWYSDIVNVAELAEHASVKGCMIIKPYGYALWENIQKVLDGKIKDSGVENAYFPLFIPEKLLKKEQEHVKGFSPEVAVVTYAGGKRLKEALIVRPTSEAIICDAFSKWISSRRDLPLLINQWANVVRWELRPRLFLRTTEFLWQEGHTVHADEQEANERAIMMLNIYKDLAEKYMAIPVIAGKKTESEKFAGALHTYTLEAMMQDGKSLQFATSHNLGQNFSRVFSVQFTDLDGTSKFAWQTSWGLSTRTIGGLIMTHSDDIGLVLPPKIAPIQIVVIPIWSKEKDKESVINKTNEAVEKLTKTGLVRVKADFSEKHPGDKYYYWERKGIPIRIEIGPRDILNNQVVLVRRDTGAKEICKQDNMIEYVQRLLEDIQNSLYKKALFNKENKIKQVETWEEFKKQIKNGNFVLAHWSGDKEVERKIKEETKATIRCVPFGQKLEKGKCIYSGKPSKERVLFAIAY